MTHISGFERSQILLLPEAVDDYVGADNLVWFIDAFVDALDLAVAGVVRVGTAKRKNTWLSERLPPVDRRGTHTILRGDLRDR